MRLATARVVFARIAVLLGLGAVALRFSACASDPADDSAKGSACEGVGIESGACSCSGAERQPIRPVAECSPRTMQADNILCCDSGDECSCFTVGCDKPSSSGSCGCDIASAPGDPSCTGTSCCNVKGKYAGQCRCGSPCGADDEPVAACSVDILTCSDGKTRVPSCLPR
jgi:hypothetical protein